MPAVTFQTLLQAEAHREQIEEWCRSKAQSYVVPFDTGESAIACRVLGKYIMYCATSDNSLTPHLALNGIWEPWVTMAIARHVQPGMRCMDIGACYGYYALLMSDIVGSTGRVQAWEPFWRWCVSLNAQVNGLPIETIGNAMASQASMLDPVIPDRRFFFNAGDVKLRPVSFSGSTKNLRVAAMPAAEPWDFIKIDVEGAEADVWAALKGVRELSPHLTVCMECTPSKHGDPENFMHRIMDDGFTLGTVGHDGVPRACSVEEALVPDTGDFRMLWLTKGSSRT